MVGFLISGWSAIFAEKNTTADDIKRCVRTNRYKYIRNYSEGPRLALPTDIEVTATRRDMGDAHLAPRPPIELYDLADDPWEQDNLVGQEVHRATEAEMDAMLHRVLEQTQDPILEGAVPRPTREADIVAGIRNPDAMQRRAENEAKVQAEYEVLRSQGA